MRLACFISALCASAVVASNAAATPLPVQLPEADHALIIEARAPAIEAKGPSVIPEPSAATDPNAHLFTIAHDITLDPETGGVSGTTSITLRADGGPVTDLALFYDAGIHVDGATAFEREVSIDQTTRDGRTEVHLALVPELASGRLLTVDVSYSGRLICAANTAVGRRCAETADAVHLFEGSALAMVVDPAAGAGRSAAERLYVVRRPAAFAAIASGDRLGDVDGEQFSASHFATPDDPSDGADFVVIGRFGEVMASGIAPKLHVDLPAADGESAQVLAGEVRTMLDFLDAQAGAALPCNDAVLTSSPAVPQLDGAFGHCVALLGQSRPGLERETLVHQLAHLRWGTLVSPADVALTNLMNEGLAVVTELDWAASERPPEEREGYLARRDRELGLLLRYHARAGALPPVRVRDATELPKGEPERTLWKYVLPAAIHEQLRVGLGEARHAAALRDWAEQCLRASCTSDDFERLLEGHVDDAARTAVAAWIHDGAPLAFGLGFEQAAADRLTVRFERERAIDLPLELFIELEDGTIERRSVLVGAQASSIDLSASGRVRRVRPNPRHDALLFSRSLVHGDVDLDGEVDGADLLHCAFRSGRSIELDQPDGEGFYGMDLEFDPRCDSNDDGRIADDDLDVIVGRFATIRERTAE